MSVNLLDQSLFHAEMLQFAFGRTLEKAEMSESEQAQALRGILNNLSTVAVSVRSDENACLKMDKIFAACANDPALASPQFEAIVQNLGPLRAELSLKQ